MQAERAAYRAWQAEARAGRVFCVDETGIAIGERIRYGYARRGQPCVEVAPYRAGRRTNVVGFVASDGTGAVTIIEGHAVCRALFAHAMRAHLVPRLRPGDTVLWDNHTIHKDPALIAEIEGRGASVRWLPRYSPELNPAEWLWSWVKRRVRRAHADTTAAVRAALIEAAGAAHPCDLAGWVRHGGFRDQPQPV